MTKKITIEVNENTTIAEVIELFEAEKAQITLGKGIITREYKNKFKCFARPEMITNPFYFEAESGTDPKQIVKYSIDINDIRNMIKHLQYVIGSSR